MQISNFLALAHVLFDVVNIYQIENSELKTALVQYVTPSHTTTENEQDAKKAPRTSLNEIDVLTSRCVYLKKELSEKCKEMEHLQCRLYAVDEYAGMFCRQDRYKHDFSSSIVNRMMAFVIANQQRRKIVFWSWNSRLN